MDKGISVVIPNYNGIALFSETLSSVFIALQKLEIAYEVIVADDCSTDDSVAYLEKNFPLVQIIKNENNSGFSVTANRGIDAAKYNLVLLLNSDVKLQEDYFIHQLKYFDRPDTFGVMGRIMGWDDDTIQDGAKYPYFHGVKIKTSGNYLLENEEEMKGGLYTMYLSGANALLNKKIFISIGRFNEIFSPFYVEDYELSIRAWRLGYKCYYEHNAICRHKIAASIKNKNKKRLIDKYYDRNKMYLHAIHLSAVKRFFYFVQLFPEVIARIFTGRWAYLQSIFILIENYGQVRRSRNELKKIAGSKKLLPINEVAKGILKSIGNKKIRRF